MEYVRNEMKQYLIFAKPTHTLLYNEEVGIKLIAEMDLFNNHIEFQICDKEEKIFYNFSFNITKAVDMFCDTIEKIKNANEI
jgi:hypothetical protein